MLNFNFNRKKKGLSHMILVMDVVCRGRLELDLLLFRDGLELESNVSMTSLP